MRHLKIIGLTVVAATALIAVASVGIAAAVEGPTSLCKVEQEVCAGGNQFAAGTAIGGATKASPTEGSRLETNLGTIVCDSSIAGKTGSETTSAGALPASISSLKFTNCTLSGNACSVGGGTGNANNLPYASKFTTEGVINKGSQTLSSGGSGEPGITIVCGAIINCTFSTASARLSFSGGAPGTANSMAESISLSRSGAKCPTTAKLSDTWFWVEVAVFIFISM